MIKNSAAHKEDKTEGIKSFAEDFSLNFVSDTDFTRLLKVSKRTTYRWRTKGILSYMLFGKQIFYHKSDFDKLIADNYHQRKG